jgi:hypothetical protein
VLHLPHGGIKQIHLQHAGLQQRLDLRLGDGRDVVKPHRRQLLHLGALDQAPVAHKRHALAAEALTGLLHLCGKRLRVLRVAPKHFRRDRLAVLVAQQTDDDLLLALLAVAGVAVVAVGVLVPFQVAAGHVVERQLRFLRPAPRGKQMLLDGRLLLAQPAQIGVQVILVETAPDAQHIAGGVDLRQPHGRQA